MNRSYLAPALSFLLVCVGCRSQTPSAENGVPHTEVTTGPVAPDTTLPADAPLYLTVRATELAPLFGPLLSMFGMEPLSDIAAQLALDPARASSAAVYPCNAALDAVGDRIARLVPRAPDAAPAGTLRGGKATAPGLAAGPTAMSCGSAPGR